MYTLVPDVKYGINVRIGVPSRLSHQPNTSSRLKSSASTYKTPAALHPVLDTHQQTESLLLSASGFRTLPHAQRLRLRCISLVVVHIHHHFSRCTSAAAGPHPSAQERPPFQSSFLLREHTCRDFSADCQPSSFLIQGRLPPHLWRLRCRKPFFFNCCPWASCLGTPSCHLIHGKSIQQSGRKSVCPF